MRARLPLALAIAGTFLVQTAIADPVGSHFEITPMGGATLFDGDLRLNGNPIKDGPYLGGRLGYQLHPLWAIEAAGGFTPTHEANPSLTLAGTFEGPAVNFFHASGNLMFTPWSGLYGGPFLFAGGGSSKIGDIRKGGIEVGGGLRYWLTDRVGLRLETRQIYYKFEQPAIGSRRINHMIASAGVTFALGAKARDTDGDGVPDRKDACPGTPIGATVDGRGCPKDSDGDGVLDGLDQCPDTPKGCTIDKSGCPLDGDGDGVCDGLDQCADTPKGATVDAKGCPHDGDGDGVWDGLDQCADTPKGATVDEKGCPHDSDGDGVWDGLDKCPGTTAGLKVDATGCPIEVMEKETELLDTGMIRLQNVNFESGKAELLAESYPVLDVVGQVLKSWPELVIEIGGHTDARGSEAANQRLSEARAKAVRDYLTGKFPELKPEQFKARGYGESRPLVPNSDELNMAKNRRVEFVVQNKDVLRRETERRRLLEKNEPAPADTTGKP